ncbi:hypothetical protein ABGV42_00570 [Paenibacillus pabuli]|uniref:hypothetical protein n=1 Tax=Paenibacillus pabuli TaxID=1472 RepID=UPI0032421490
MESKETVGFDSLISGHDRLEERRKLKKEKELKGLHLMLRLRQISEFMSDDEVLDTCDKVSEFIDGAFFFTRENYSHVTDSRGIRNLDETARRINNLKNRVDIYKNMRISADSVDDKLITLSREVLRCIGTIVTYRYDVYSDMFIEKVTECIRKCNWYTEELDQLEVVKAVYTVSKAGNFSMVLINSDDYHKNSEVSLVVFGKDKGHYELKIKPFIREYQKTLYRTIGRPVKIIPSGYIGKVVDKDSAFITFTRQIYMFNGSPKECSIDSYKNYKEFVLKSLYR